MRVRLIASLISLTTILLIAIANISLKLLVISSSAMEDWV